MERQGRLLVFDSQRLPLRRRRPLKNIDEERAAALETMGIIAFVVIFKEGAHWGGEKH